MKKFFVYQLWLLLLLMVVEADLIKQLSDHQKGPAAKLFVFGDSYVDTGNDPKFFSKSWRKPYGITFPGKPSGRFSDGRVLTDYIASYIGIDSPLPYERRKASEKIIKDGINFAFGGSGVFDTKFKYFLPNMSTQINFFQKLLEQNVYSKQDLDSSIALVSVAGNDYAAYLAQNGTLQGLPAFTTSLISQLVVNLQRIHDLGVGKIGVTALQPFGCLPRSTASSSYKLCNESENSVAKFHNQLLQQSVQKLKDKNKETIFVILDLYGAFMSILKGQEIHPGTSKFLNPLIPCCMGVDGAYSCGSIGSWGENKYTVCDKPQQSLFWDNVHPTQAGWQTVSLALQSSLHQLY